MMITCALASLLAMHTGGVSIADPAEAFASRFNAFGARLWQAQHLGEANQAVAPLSVGVCLSMLIDGANPPTQGQITGTLGFSDISPAGIDQGIRDLVASLKSAPGNSFTMANGIWAKGGLKVDAGYQSKIHNFFGGEIRRFGTPDAAMLREVNEWVKSHTKNRIPKIFDSLDPLTSVVLVNALTFDGKWTKPFDKSLTQGDVFHGPAGDLKVPTMHQSGRYIFEEQGSAKILGLPYEGDRFEMKFILPGAGQSPSQAMSQWLKNPKSVPGNGRMATRIAIPKFKMECTYDLKPALGALGLAPLYRDAKFGRIAADLNRQTKIDQIQHRTYIKVDEEGTKAAAATGIAMTTRAMLQPVEFILDRPFAYAIVDKKTGVVVMMGTVVKPELD
jgi:serine protease inhibitor